MLKNYVKIAFRTLRKQRAYYFVNIVGLAVGIACCLLILMFVQDELSYDRYHEGADRIHRLVSDVTPPQGDGTQALTKVPGVFIPSLKTDYPALEAVTGFFSPGTVHLFRYKDKQLAEENYFYADSSFFQVFPFAFLRGNPETALIQPNTAVLTRSAAARYFGDEDPLGKVLVRGEGTNPQFDHYTVMGVIEDVPAQSHFRFDFLLSAQLPPTIPRYIYVRLKPGYAAADLEMQLPGLVSKTLGPQYAALMTAHLQPLTSIHLHSDRLFEIEANSDVRYVYIFTIIALLVLVVACINFINLSTARSARRAHEVGMRKAIGADRGQLVRQFLSESILTTLLALPLSIFLVELARPFFNEIAGKELSLGYLQDPIFWLSSLGLIVVIGLIGGSYPALVLSGLQPLNVLRGRLGSGLQSRGVLRRTLVVTQFVISLGLIIGALAIRSQVAFIQNKNLGFEKEQLIVLQGGWALGSEERYTTFREAVLQQAKALDVTRVSMAPGDEFAASPVQPEGFDEPVDAVTMSVDYNFAEPLGIAVTAGRSFSEAFGSDREAAGLINRAMARQLGWQDALGKTIGITRVKDGQPVQRTLTVVGVVEDFHVASLHHAVEPVVLTLPLGYRDAFKVLVKIRAGEAEATLAELEKLWKAFLPGRPFEYAFLDDRVDQLYRAEQRLEKLSTGFALIGIFIACLGLFGLAAFAAEQRAKEISIRKVFGASADGVLWILLKDFGKLLVIAFVLASPVAWFVLTSWLDNFAYRTSLGWELFALAGIAAVVVATGATGYQVFKAAWANPVDILRSE